MPTVTAPPAELCFRYWPLPPVEDYPRPAGDPDAMKRAAEVLGKARKPIVLAGGGVIAAEASRALLAVAERLAAPVIMTGHGRGAVPDDHPFSLGDGWGRLTYFDELFAEADATLVSALGPTLHRAYLAVKRSEAEAFAREDANFETKHHFWKF